MLTVPREIWRVLYPPELNDQPNHPTFSEQAYHFAKEGKWAATSCYATEERGSETSCYCELSGEYTASRTSCWTVSSNNTPLLRELNFKPYRLSVCQELKAGDYGWHVAYCQWLERFAHRGASRFDNVYFSDKAWVHLDGYINSQNYRLWCCENPHAFVESGLHSLKIGIWCGLSRRKIIGSIFFEQSINAEQDQSITLDFIANLEGDERYCWLQQDGNGPYVKRHNGVS